MAVARLGCPHCGHDGTRETSRPPLGSYGFNYLVEGLVSGEVGGYDEAGRLRLSGEFRCEGTQLADARFECRACWRTFPVPEGLAWAAKPEEVPRPSELATIPRAAGQDAQSPTALRIAKLEVSVARLAQALEDTPSLKAEVAALRDQTAALLRAREQPAPKPGQAAAGIVEQVAQLRETIARQAADAKERADALDAAHREAGQARTWLGEVIAQLEVGQQAIRQRLDAQADVIRGLHAAAQEHMTRVEELRAAIQRLEETVTALGQVKPLPEDL